MRALAEAPQLLLHYTETEYEYLMSWDYYKKKWPEVKPTISFKQLPVLVIDDTYEIAQSIAIMSYIEKIAGISIKDNILAAKADAITQSAQELFMPLNPTVNFSVGEDFISKKDAMKDFLLSRFDDLDRSIKSSGKKFFIDNTPFACDFTAFHHLDLSKKLDETLVTQFPRLEKFLDDISSIDPISKYLQNRPQLINVSVEPKLVIDGNEHTTGTNQT
tara:strand:- start:191 stop:844 length:654 start_codon:yes stop_codon:yes gene_type:complete